MARTLGLDIGTNSIGWCVVEDGKTIIAMGSRIFPVGVKEDTYANSGTEESRNAARRKARGIRRGYARYKLRRAELERILEANGMMFDKTKSLPTKQLYGLRRDALDLRLELDELGRIFFLMNQRRGFKSNRKEQAQGDEAKKLTSTKLAMREFEEKMHAAGCRTAGEYLASLFDNQPANWHNENEPRERIREKQRVRRELYQQEFDLIWAKQREYHPDLLTDELKRELRDRVIFFQRKLKSAKHLVSKCRFEPNKHVMPRSHPLFQEFRYLQKLADMRVTYQDRVNDPLTLQERQALALELSKTEKVNVTLIKEWLDYPRSARINDMGDDLKGNSTWSRIRKAVGDDWFERLTEEARMKLWHTLYFAADEGWIEDYAQRALGMNDEQAKLFASVNLELDYGSISHKAASRIVPYMRDGHDFATACAEAGYHHSQNELDNPDRELKDKLSGADIDELRNPLVQMTVNETARLVSAIIKAHGRPDMVRVELLRELKKPKAVREKMRNAMRDKERIRDEYRSFLKERGILSNPYPSDIKKFELWLELEYSEQDATRLRPDLDLKAFKKFAEAVSPKDKEKFQLWLECDRISPYTGKAIPLSKLFTEAYHVEHILPYSRSLDDSFVNKTLCEDTVNDAKGNMTPLEYFATRSEEEMKAFKQRVKNFSEAKLAKFLATEVKDDFLNSQLTNSAYIGTEVRKLLRKAFKDVRVTNGQLTGLLRNKVWRLNDLLNTAEDQKDRDDHRHHALDALVIACTSQSLVQRISRESQFDFRGVQRVPDIGLPWPSFRIDAAQHLNGMLVSYRNGKRLLTAKKNRYRHSKAHEGRPDKVQRTLAVRGPLHEETLYGRVTLQHKGAKEETYVVRKALNSLTKVEQLENIVDPVVRRTVQEHVARSGSLRDALKSPIYMPVKEHNAGKLIPIRSVRMRVSTEEMIELRPKTFVEPGNNFCIAIYEDAKGKRAFRTISFFVATQRVRKREPLYPSDLDGKRLVMALKQRDLVVLYEKHPDEIQWSDSAWLASNLYIVKKFDKNGKIGLILHKAANANPDYPKRYPGGTVYMKTANTLKALPVRLNALGTPERP